MGMEIIFLAKMGCTVVAAVASDIDVFMFLASIKDQTWHVDITQFSSQVISAIQSICVKVARGTHMRRVISNRSHLGPR